MRYKWLLFLTILWLTLAARAQEYPVRSYTVRDGLPHSNVFRIFQDSRGFIWCCTGYGLSRFDGTVFHNYTESDGLAGSTVLSLSEPLPGIRLVSTYGGGVAVMTDSSIRRLQPAGDLLPDYIVYTCYYHHSYWAIATGTPGSKLFRICNGRCTHIPVQSKAGRPVAVHKALLTSEGLMLATGNGLYLISADNIPRPLWPESVSGNVADVCTGKAGDYWLALPDRLLQVRNGVVRHHFSFTGTAEATCLAGDTAGSIWVGTSGAGVYRITGDSVKSRVAGPPLTNVIVNDIHIDTEGNVWLATHGKGIFVLTTTRVVQYRPAPHRLNTYCKSIAPLDSTAVLVSSIGTISTWENGVLHPMAIPTLGAGDYIYFIKAEQNRILWGTPYGLYTRPRKPPFTTTQIPASGSNTVVGALAYCTDSNGTSWVGAFNGLYRLRGDMLWRVDDPVLTGKRCNAIAEGTDGTLWLGTGEGLIAFDGKSGRSIPPPAGTAGLNILSLCTDRLGRVWIAAGSQGLLFYNNGQYRTYDAAGTGYCTTVYADGHTVWVGTLGGLCAVDVRTLRLQRFGPEVYPVEVMSICAAAGKLFLGTVDGLSVIDKQGPPLYDTAPPPLYITQVRTDQGRLLMPTALQLPYQKSRLGIDFIGLSYRYAGSVEYRYRLEGLSDAGWHLTRDHTLDIPSLPAGRYTFLLCCRINNGAWSPALRLPMTVATPFWKTGWFAALAATICIVLVFGITRWRTLRREALKRARLTTLNKMAYLEQQALTALINPHFIFNCMNAVQHYLNRNDHEKANEYLADFAGLIRMTMEQAQDAFITLSRELERIRLYLALEQLRFGNDLQYDLIIDPAVSLSTRIPNMILQPYIENAVWHGIMPKNGPGRVVISFRLQEEQLIIAVTDDGVGMRLLEKHSGTHRRSYGMQLTENRLMLLQQLLHRPFIISISNGAFDNADFPGTRITISVPANITPSEILSLDKY